MFLTYQIVLVPEDINYRRISDRGPLRCLEIHEGGRESKAKARLGVGMGARSRWV